MFSRFMDWLHVPLTIGNWVLCLTNLVSGNFTSAAVSGAIAAILTWQLTW
jgi:hypothetical protein